MSERVKNEIIFSFSVILYPYYTFQLRLCYYRVEELLLTIFIYAEEEEE